MKRREKDREEKQKRTTSPARLEKKERKKVEDPAVAAVEGVCLDKAAAEL